MRIQQSIKEMACVGLLHYQAKKALARDLGVSKGCIRDWSIFVENDNFDWVRKDYIGQRKAVLAQAVDYWFDQYPIGYSDVARKFGFRPAGVYEAIQRRLAKLPEELRPKRVLFWDSPPAPSLGAFRMEIEKLSDIPADRPLTLSERKAILKAHQENRDRLICAAALLEVACETCKDELKKKELRRQLELTNKALASFAPVKSCR